MFLDLRKETAPRGHWLISQEGRQSLEKDRSSILGLWRSFTHDSLVLNALQVHLKYVHS